MGEKGEAAKAVSRHLHDAIERVREDVAKVEFWADAVSGFTQPVPDYDPGDVTVWLPSEQASAIEHDDKSTSDDGSTSDRRDQRES